MKLKDLKEKLNQFPQEMDDYEVLLCDGHGDFISDIDIYSNTIIRVNDKRGNLIQFTYDKNEWWYVGKNKVTIYDNENIVTEEIAIFIG